MTPICLITGGAGFIGSHLVEALKNQHYHVRVFDDFSSGDEANLIGFRSGLEVIEGTLTDPKSLANAMKGVRWVFHLGAIASVQFSVENPLASHAVCATGTLNVLEAARRAGVQRVIYAGSASAYGIPEGDIQTEDQVLRPLSPYAAAKLAGEMYAEAFAATFGLETVRLRFFNIFGPRQRPDSPYSGVIALFIKAMSTGMRPRIFGDGLQSRDFTYVSDVVQALLKAAQTPGISGRVYNVGTGRRSTLLDLVATLNRLLASGLVPDHAAPRSGDIRHSCADISRIRRELGYEPRVSLQEGLEQTLRWYRDHAKKS